MCIRDRLYDRHLMQALFQLQIGNPRSSFAVEIARKIGLPEEVIADASEIVGSEYINACLLYTSYSRNAAVGIMAGKENFRLDMEAGDACVCAGYFWQSVPAAVSYTHLPLRIDSPALPPRLLSGAGCP